MLDLTSKTLVLLHGDHGWGLGEGNFWHKFSNMEHSARVPLLVRAPWLGPASAGRVVTNLVELVDVFPSLASLAGTPPPTFANGTVLPLDGADFSALLLSQSNGSGAAVTSSKQYAYSQFPRCDGGRDRVFASLGKFTLPPPTLMGLPGDLSTGSTSVDSTAGRPVR